MNLYLLVVYFFCWITVGIDVSLAAESRGSYEKEQAAGALSITTVMDRGKPTRESTIGSDHSCQLNKKEEERIFQCLGSREYVMDLFKKNLEDKLICHLEGCKEAANMVTLEIDVYNKMKNIIAVFLLNTAEIKDKLLQVLPKLDDEDAVLLRTGYQKYNGLNWSYENKNIVTEADAVTKTIYMAALESPSDELLNARMYHVLNEKVIEMKNLFDIWNNSIDLAEQLQKFVVSTSISVKYLPFDATGSAMDKIFAAFNAISTCACLFDKAASMVELSDNSFMIDNALLAMEELLKETNKQIKANIREIDGVLQSVAEEEDEHLQQNLIAQWFISFYNVYEKELSILSKEKGNNNFENLFKLMRSTSWSDKKVNAVFKELQRKLFSPDKLLYGNMNLQNIESTQHFKNKSTSYEKIVKAMFRIVYLSLWKKETEEVMAFVESAKNEVASESVKQKSKYTGHASVSKGISENLKEKLHFFKLRINRACDEHVKNTELISMFHLYKSVQAGARKLQYFWGTSNQISTEIMKEKGYMHDKGKRNEALKRIAVHLYHSVFALDKMMNYRI